MWPAGLASPAPLHSDPPHQGTALRPLLGENEDERRHLLAIGPSDGALFRPWVEEPDGPKAAAYREPRRHGQKTLREASYPTGHDHDDGQLSAVWPLTPPQA